MRVCGLMIGNMGRVRRRGLMAQFTKESTKLARSTVVAPLNGTTGRGMWDDSLKIISMDRATTYGLTDVSTSANGKQTKCMDTVYSPGPMANATKANIIKIKKRVTAFSTGPTEVSTRVAGRTVSSMAREPTFPPAVPFA